MGPDGTIVLPEAVRDELHLDEGTELACFVEDGAVVVTTDEALEEEVQAAFASLDRSLVDELIADPRAGTGRDHR